MGLGTAGISRAAWRRSLRIAQCPCIFPHRHVHRSVDGADGGNVAVAVADPAMSDTMKHVLIGRAIFGILLSVAMLVAAAPVSHAKQSVASPKLHDCCEKEKSQQPAPKKDCSGGACAMQCCRLIPAPAENVPQLSGRVAVVETVIIVPNVLHSLIDPQAIFHPPRV